MKQPSAFDRFDRALDWAGLPLSVLLLAIGIREYRDGASLGWPVGGAVLVLVSLWVIYRGMDRRNGKVAKPVQ
ncbi:hypothetical protein QC334_09120 [Streptomyces sp. DH18]|uniref:hypothetical protein n=1 Tax=unclassified Streptomyces TaxID=2593676 RepID=UPI001E457D5C|nr:MULTISPECIES: hypothetical protein [unclassified Streptomyces]MDG9682900.1 hypothetical protein [Streptomyces sp. DH18]